jgi:hypothetical protein
MGWVDKFKLEIAETDARSTRKEALAPNTIDVYEIERFNETDCQRRI